jgi:ATP-dependent DNA helicase RecG
LFVPSSLPINIRDLLYFRGVEQQRVEFKKSWNMGPTAMQVLHTLCAFANDYHNVNGGYIVIGVEEDKGVARLPPAGLDPGSLDQIQRQIRGLGNRLDPVYQPLISPEIVDGRHIVVIWAPGSDTRPHQAPESREEKGSKRAYYVRLGSETCEAKDDVLTALMQLTAKVPFDDRRAQSATLDDLRATLVREFLRDVRSDLIHEREDAEIYRKMRLTAPVNGHEVPRNIALLFFSDEPERFFPGARIEVAQFADDTGGDVIEERTFQGPLAHQVRRSIEYLREFAASHIHKIDDRADAEGWVSYPLPALEEALVNAVYHRSYESTPEPIKIYLFPDRIEVTSYPGPVPGLEIEHLAASASVPPVPARNRRIGELFKELKLAEQRGTGIPKIFRSMQQNNSPRPRFDFDLQRTYFRVTLPAHPEYVALLALRDAATLEAVGEARAALRRIEEACRNAPGSGILASRLIQQHAQQHNLQAAREVFERFRAADARTSEARVIGAWAGALLEAERETEARAVLDELPAILSTQDAIELAIQERRAGREKRAHELFQRAGVAVLRDPRALLEFAQSKASLTRSMWPRNTVERQALTRMLREARDMLERVIQLDTSSIRHAWAWFELGRVRQRLNEPRSETLAAFEKACELAPKEERFRHTLDEERKRRSGRTRRARGPRRRD